jgi:hypothetical protein
MSTATLPTAAGSAVKSEPVVGLRRRTIDSVLVAIGSLVVVVLLAAGGLLTWGSRFANDYVHDELSSQHITFPAKDALITEGRPDLAKYGGRTVDTGDEAQAYASYIGGHLDKIGGGQTYADLGATESAAKADVAAAVKAGKPQAEIDALQAKADGITNTRNTLFKGETLRGLLLSAYSWSTIGRIAGIAAAVAFAAAALMIVLVVLGAIHHHRIVSRKDQPEPLVM